MKRLLLIGLPCLTVLLLCFLLWPSPSPPASASNSFASIKEKEVLIPLPSISPQEVVDIQLKAMQQNDQPYEDHGIEVAFRFASPSNKETTGTLKEFIALVHNETYQSLLEFQRYGLDDVVIKGNKAMQKVTLIDANDQPVVYYFQLSLQQEEPYVNCWMTDGVVRD
jgi:hypothetical protein